jgi:UDP-N-acetylmuramoyl-tripeptide--D-alanyl-D-alanine ligase
MGMNRIGEIAELAAVLKPNIALITNIGTAHIGCIGTKQQIAEEKKSIFSQFAGNEIALIPEDDAYASFLSDGVNGEVRLFGLSSMKKSLETYFDLGIEGTELIWEGNRVRFGLPGYFNLMNALAGIASSRAVPVSARAVVHGLESVKPLFGRGEIIKGEATVLRDCYNANPEALLAAIDFADSLAWKDGRKIYVIGSMLELGDVSESMHEKIGEALAASQADKVFLFGKETLPALKVLEASGKNIFQTDDMKVLSEAVAASVKPGDFVLLKGSRGTALETLTDILICNDGGVK